ncbi:protein ABIL2 [Morus notabilis]|uniref:protein ABIL2 n=1 Tax=Morus notabilis TaxID=981085 RepID=UPI000CECFEF2|nr:protein ABIL2 [Morus notabilis]XP_024028558.1 protein ABIL2 [Morus notabilis]
MESVNFTSSVSAPKPSHHDELFMQQRMVFSESLNELKNLRKQLYSAAEYFELSYSKDDQKQIVVETLKDYTIKAFINTVDHLGSMADKVNNFVDEKTVDVSEADLKFSCIEQRQRTSQDLIDRSGLFQQSLAFSFPRHHKRYIIPGGAAKNAIGQSNLMYHGVENDWFQFRNATTREISPTIVSEENSTSTPSSQSSPKTFHLTRTASKAERKEPANHFPHSGLVKRSTTVNSSASKQRYPTEPWRSVSMSIHTERDRAKSPEHSGLNRRILKALVSMRKRKKDATSNKYNFNGN